MKSLIDSVREELCYQETDILTEDDVSVILALYFESKVSALHSFTKEIIYRNLQHEGILEYLTFDISPILENEEYLIRVKKMILERHSSLDSAAPCLRIAVSPMTGEQIDNQLGERPNWGLIFGAESIYFQDTVHGFQNDALVEEPLSPVNVLGVHHSWLIENGRETRQALLTDENGFVKDVLFERNVSLHGIQILHLPKKEEQGIHRLISSQFNKTDILQINPWYVSAQRADNKFMSYNLWKDKILTPLTYLIPKTSSPSKIQEMVEKLVKETSQSKIIILPNQGTEGVFVRHFKTKNFSEIVKVINYISEQILPIDDCIIREKRGNTCCLAHGTNKMEYRPFTLRIHIARDGRQYHAESGYAQISDNQNNPITSLSQGGKIIPLSDVFSNLYFPISDKEEKVMWEKYCVVEHDIDEIKRAACKATELLNQGLGEEDTLKFAGIDILLEVGESSSHDNKHKVQLTPLILEINPRPAGLAHSYELSTDKFPKLKISQHLFQNIKTMKNEEKVHV